MLVRSVGAYFQTKRFDDAEWRPYSRGERIFFAIIYLLGGVLWGTTFGIALGYLLNHFKITSFSVTFFFCIIVFVLLRFGKLFSGSVITENERNWKEIFEKKKDK